MAIINIGTDQHFSCHYKKLTLPGQRNTTLTSYTWKRTQSSPARRVIILVTFYLISLHLKHTDSANRAIAHHLFFTALLSSWKRFFRRYYIESKARAIRDTQQGTWTDRHETKKWTKMGGEIWGSHQPEQGRAH